MQRPEMRGRESERLSRGYVNSERDILLLTKTRAGNCRESNVCFGSTQTDTN
jgi:hypothetical protein